MATNKDRLGDKLREREKAEEDRYFAQQDREKLDKLREESQAGPVELGRCPRCGTVLAERTVDEVPIDVCDDCGGVWLDKGELEQLIERENEGWASRWFRDVLAGK
jgi:hypothetical protein